MKNEFDIPSFYLHQLNALFIFIALFVFFMNYYVIKKSNPYQHVVLWLLFSLAFGIHGISHLGAEYVYGYNPIRNLFMI